MNEIAIKDFKVGDVYYVEMNKSFYFFSINFYIKKYLDFISLLP